MIKKLLSWLGFYHSALPAPPQPLSAEDKTFLNHTVMFYRTLNTEDKTRFEQRCLLFLQTVDIIGHDILVERKDELLVACGSVILAWGFEQWHYVRVDTVILVSGSFNDHSEFGQPDSNIQGLVGNQHLAGKMILSQPALHAGFSNSRDKQNVALHEFSHLIDMADGDVDGLPKQLLPLQQKQQGFALPWLSLINKKINEINRGDSNIRDYGATNPAEFLAVATEYFFERPILLKNKHPHVYQALTRFYQQDLAEMKQAIQPRKKAPCPCGSGRRYKRCCLPE